MRLVEIATAEYETSVAARHVRTLVGLLAPDWRTKPAGDFLPAVRDWENEIAEYDRQMSQTLR